MPTTAAEGTEVARDQLTYYIKRCPVDAENCKGQKWNKKNWGFTRETAILNFKEHLWNKHGIKNPGLVEELYDRLEFECYIGEQQVPEPPPPQPSVAPKGLHGMPLPPVKRTLADQLVAEKQKRMKTEPPDELPDEPPDESPADEPAASESSGGNIRAHTAAMIHAQEQIEDPIGHATKIVRKARLHIKVTDELIDHLEAAGATMTNIVEQCLGNGD